MGRKSNAKIFHSHRNKKKKKTTTIRKTKTFATYASSHRKHSTTETSTNHANSTPTQLMKSQLTQPKHSPTQHMQKEPPPSHQLFLLSPLTTPRIFSRSCSVNRIGSSPSSSPIHPRTHSESNEAWQPLIGITLCTEPTPSWITDHQLKTILKPLSSIKTINDKNICNPYLFRDAAKVTTFVRTAGNRTRELWRFIQEASHADLRLAELEHSSLKKCFLFVQAGSRF